MPLDAVALGADVHLRASDLALADEAAVNSWTDVFGNVFGPHPAWPATVGTFRASDMNGGPAVQPGLLAHVLAAPIVDAEEATIIMAANVSPSGWLSTYLQEVDDTSGAPTMPMVTLAIGDYGDDVTAVYELESRDAAQARWYHEEAGTPADILGPSIVAVRRTLAGMTLWRNGSIVADIAHAMAPALVDQIRFDGQSNESVAEYVVALAAWDDAKIEGAMQVLMVDHGLAAPGGPGGSARGRGHGARGDIDNPGSKQYPPEVLAAHNTIMLPPTPGMDAEIDFDDPNVSM